MLKIGLDVGSTTVKAVVTDQSGTIQFKKYFRHYSKISEKITEILEELSLIYTGEVYFAMSGSAGMGIAEQLDVLFIQEVYATKVALGKLGQIDAAIELGGEDAKILFLTNGMEVRMNGTCAGGTGAFIDQTAALLGITADDINNLSQKAEKIYPIASRCGVFAKTDIQPLVNQGAKNTDLSKSILYAIVNQTVGGLAQGRKIEGNVAYLGGPLTFLSELRKCFDEVLGIEGIFPQDSLYFVAKGAAQLADKQYYIKDLIKAIKEKPAPKTFNTLMPLFRDRQEYNDFKERHDRLHIKRQDIKEYTADAYLGVDSGSTTIKMVIIGKEGELLTEQYSLNKGNPVVHVQEFLNQIYSTYPNLRLVGGAATGYGEDLIKTAFNLSGGIVETAAHFTAAKKLMPDVEFVIDIGGQDMKCFKVKNGAIDDIFLNEACSSGCGSFLQTFADTLGYSIKEFANHALFADSPVDLGSRCTVFMNSSIKQAQKDGASIQNISAGLAVSVVKNALYKVIRVKDTSLLGSKIVVQGGTFLSDAVLRAFEQEMGVEVIRPDIAGLMGAYGAALYAIDLQEQSIISKQELNSFDCETKNVRCGLCPNNCGLTINRFNGGRRYISGNKCERPSSGVSGENDLNIFDYKLKELNKYRAKPDADTTKRKIGLPFVLNMYELLPFWYTFFNHLGFECVISPVSDSNTFKKGQTTIPSDTICFPAKLVHGHIQYFIDKQINHIFYPCMSYNFDEKTSDNCFNCPVVAYYPEVIGISMQNETTKLIQCFVDVNNKKVFSATILSALQKEFSDLTLKQVKEAASLAYKEYYRFIDNIRKRGQEIIRQAREKGMDIIALIGRPYHADPEVNKGIPRLISAMNKAVISEDALPVMPSKTSILNQWTYHARLYSAADYVVRHKDVNLVQMISFGCGLDAVTSDEVRSHLEKSGRLYTQLKIDEITNLGAVKIRIKSLLAALDSPKR